MKTMKTAVLMLILLSGGPAFGFTDDTITDTRTMLIWQKQDDGAARTWEDAITYCENLGLGGQTDWRLPNVKELKTIVDNTKQSPAIDAAFFPNTQSTYYWSSTTVADPLVANHAWVVSFGTGGITRDGIVKTEAEACFVRCVRGGQ